VELSLRAQGLRLDRGVLNRWTRAADTQDQGTSSIPALLDILAKTVATRRPAAPAPTGRLLPSRKASEPARLKRPPGRPALAARGRGASAALQPPKPSDGRASYPAPKPAPAPAVSAKVESIVHSTSSSSWRTLLNLPKRPRDFG
jgi:hypothetical protein